MGQHDNAKGASGAHASHLKMLHGYSTVLTGPRELRAEIEAEAQKILRSL